MIAKASDILSPTEETAHIQVPMPASASITSLPNRPVATSYRVEVKLIKETATGSEEMASDQYKIEEDDESLAIRFAAECLKYCEYLEQEIAEAKYAARMAS